MRIKSLFNIIWGGGIGLIIGYFLFIPPQEKISDLSFNSAIKKAMPSVVYVYSADCTDNFYGCPLGAGVIMDDDGYVATNFHVINGVNRLLVILADSTKRNVKTVGYDKMTDLAVLKIDPSSTQPIRTSDGGKINVGDFVLAIGNPYNLVGSVSHGVVSAVGRSGFGVIGRQTFIQTDASINKGNSGGPLINSMGEMVGLNTLVFSVDKDMNDVRGISFALPVELVKLIMKKIITDGRVIRGCIGVETIDTINDKNGKRVVITSVRENSPAYRSGVLDGDILKKIGVLDIHSSQDALNLLAETPPGMLVGITLTRGGRIINLNVKVSDCE
ncbi:S1C family serine protease [Serratia bockelmannii]|uniref:S1C family serine protease n=1 Tax=Serratia bockelmannii TaxID=2703793 RepID=UPI002360F4A2|nr:trypsin-like peptidase domain-containing protein [Serratia bockelmannii]